ncbi:MAG: adenylate kinase [Armatimonadota bacterium]|nr:adenylate kinase [Armatimonadota bacterium]MDR7449482.1 adenylate kinase [Armatimonadota bacterium]MDR7459987.1 adenylate kinase [Armatimonadota bacterium]MDR7480680.1 adenylate kinase [Armatimonadota bacterium]MDR7489200.1 adenylate kinase [Armatimonadota bacterium]
MNVIVIGPHGAGKGTQARLVAARWGIPHIATGDMLREAAAAGTPLGLEARRYMDAGELVPDEVMIGIVEERLAQPDARAGFILDGFPRTIPQAEALERALARQGRRIDRVVEFLVREETLVERVSGRRVCRAAGHIYHVAFRPPRVPGVCDVDGSPLYQREDDRPEAVRRRVEVYRQQTTPVVDFYRARSVYAALDAEGEVEEVYARLERVLRAPSDAGLPAGGRE